MQFTFSKELPHGNTRSPVGRKMADLHRDRLLVFILINTLEKPLGLLFSVASVRRAAKKLRPLPWRAGF
jgi:hypothetical protein